MPVKNRLGVSSGRVTWRNRRRRPGAVDARRVVVVGRDRLEPREEDDRVGREALPDRHRDDRRHRPEGIADPLLGRDAEHAEELVEEAGRGAVDPGPDEADRDRRGDERQEVHRPDPGDAPQRLVERERETERQRQPERHRHDRVEGRVAERHPEPPVVEQPGVVVEADPVGRAQQVPAREADPERRDDRAGREEREADHHRRDEQPGPAFLVATRTAALRRTAAVPREAQPDPARSERRAARSGHRTLTLVAPRRRYGCPAARMPLSSSLTVAIASAAVLLGALNTFSSSSVWRIVLNSL